MLSLVTELLLHPGALHYKVTKCVSWAIFTELPTTENYLYMFVGSPTERSISASIYVHNFEQFVSFIQRFHCSRVLSKHEQLEGLNIRRFHYVVIETLHEQSHCSEVLRSSSVRSLSGLWCDNIISPHSGIARSLVSVLSGWCYLTNQVCCRWCHWKSGLVR